MFLRLSATPITPGAANVVADNLSRPPPKSPPYPQLPTSPGVKVSEVSAVSEVSEVSEVSDVLYTCNIINVICIFSKKIYLILSFLLQQG